MNTIERFEAAVIGTGLSGLVAGYVLKHFKIQFSYIEMHTEHSCLDELEAFLDRLTQDWSYENSEHGLMKAQELVSGCMKSVGIDPKLPLRAQDEERLAIRLEHELKEELASVRRIRNLTKLGNYYQAMECSSDVAVDSLDYADDTEHWNDGNHAETDVWSEDALELDCIICQEDLWKACACAEAVYAEKQLRLNAYMKQLRIPDERKAPRKLVYITHSRSWFYARECVQQYALQQGVAPLNPFMNYGYYMDQRVDKDEIVASCHQMIRSSEEMWVFGPISEGMLSDIVVAVMEGKDIRFFSISENAEEIKELDLERISFEREVHAGQIHKSDLLNFIRSTAPRTQEYKQMTLFG